MAGKTLRCDHDGCEAVFPPAPVEGIHWLIRAEAEEAGWVSSRHGLYDVDDDVNPNERDFCPEHVGDLAGDELYASRAVARLDAAIIRALSGSTAHWKSVAAAPGSEPLTVEKLQAVIDEIRAGPRVPEIERRGTTIYVDGVPTWELNTPLLTRSWDWIPATREILFPSPLQMAVHEYAEDRLARQLAERGNRIIDANGS